MRDFRKTEPEPLGANPIDNADILLVGRYGTDDMGQIWGPINKFQYTLDAQSTSIDVLHKISPEIVPKEHRDELVKKASLKYINPQRIRQLEEETGHDVIAINTAWEEQVSPEAAAHINKLKTSADSTVPALAIQLQKSMEVYTDSIENLRDITLEMAMSDPWFSTPHINQTHGYDALPSVAGRAFVFYAECLQSGIYLLKYFHDNSTVGKWGDVNGEHQSATSSDVDGIKLQEEYCKKLGIGHMIAPAQIPAREFNTDIVYAVVRTKETVANLARYVRKGRNQDCGVFKLRKKTREGSSGMPHKTEYGGNPTSEEQAGSSSHCGKGNLMTSVSSIQFDYGRDLEDSASNRVMFEELFKFADHTARRMANTIYNLELVPERCIERFDRTYGISTSQNLMNYLTDHRKNNKPMTRKNAHKLAFELAHKAYNEKIEYKDVCLQDKRINSRFDEETIIRITDPFQYTGESQRQIEMVFNKYHGKKAFEKKPQTRKVI